jgi:hypothetical protein
MAVQVYRDVAASAVATVSVTSTTAATSHTAAFTPLRHRVQRRPTRLRASVTGGTAAGLRRREFGGATNHLELRHGHHREHNIPGERHCRDLHPAHAALRGRLDREEVVGWACRDKRWRVDQRIVCR